MSGCSEKETVVQLAKMLALFGARGKGTDKGLQGHDSSASTSGDEASSKMQLALVLHAGLASGTWLVLGKEKV